MGSILAVGAEPTLLYTRSLVLERVGATVRCSDSDQAASMLTAYRFDLVVLCHSLLPDDLDRICSKVRLHQAQARILFVGSPNAVNPGPVLADARVDLGEGPQALVRTAKRLIDGAAQDTTAAEGNRATMQPLLSRSAELRLDPSTEEAELRSFSKGSR